MILSETALLGGAIAAVAGYVFGAIPVGVLVARQLRQPDPRSHDSTHTGATNVYRTGGVWPAALVLLGDVGKGMLAAWTGTTLAGPTGLVLAGTTAIVGHCWSIFLRGEGGMGLATAGGLLLWISLPAFVVEVLILAVILYLVRDRYRTAILGVPAAPIILYLIAEPTAHVLLALAVTIVLLGRFLSEHDQNN